MLASLSMGFGGLLYLLYGQINIEKVYNTKLSHCAQNLSTFRAEVNMLCANHGREAIQMEDAMRFLRATKFNATRAIEIYKNYQVCV